MRKSLKNRIKKAEEPYKIVPLTGYLQYVLY